MQNVYKFNLYTCAGKITITLKQHQLPIPYKSFWEKKKRILKFDNRNTQNLFRKYNANIY